MRKSLWVSVVVVVMAVLAPVMVAVPSSAVSASCHDEARIVVKDFSITLPKVFGEKSTVILYQIKLPVSVDPECQTKAIQCFSIGCVATGHADAASTSGGAGVVIQLQTTAPFVSTVSAITRWYDLGKSAACRKNGANQSCSADTEPQFLEGPRLLRALCHWKSKFGTVDQNAKITTCRIDMTVS